MTALARRRRIRLGVNLYDLVRINARLARPWQAETIVPPILADIVSADILAACDWISQLPEPTTRRVWWQTLLPAVALTTCRRALDADAPVPHPSQWPDPRHFATIATLLATMVLVATGRPLNDLLAVISTLAITPAVQSRLGRELAAADPRVRQQVSVLLQMTLPVYQQAPLTAPALAIATPGPNRYIRRR